jgi:hypothetical protein
LVIDPVEENMYFKSGREVYRANFDGSDKELIYEDETDPVQVFTLDWIGRNMVWVDSRSITVGNMSFSDGVRIKYNKNVDNASLAIDPNAG